MENNIMKKRTICTGLHSQTYTKYEHNYNVKLHEHTPTIYISIAAHLYQKHNEQGNYKCAIFIRQPCYYLISFIFFMYKFLKLMFNKISYYFMH